MKIVDHLYQNIEFWLFNFIYICYTLHLLCKHIWVLAQPRSYKIENDKTVKRCINERVTGWLWQTDGWTDSKPDWQTDRQTTTALTLKDWTPVASQLGDAQWIDSATLYPHEIELTAAPGNITMNSSHCCSIRHTGIPASVSTLGEI